MSLKEELSSVMGQDLNTLYKRNLLKEILQNYALNFIYNSRYNKLIFTGGTCLRKVYGLNRLSEDLDFDYERGFNLTGFDSDITGYFVSQGYQNITYRWSKLKNTLFIKFPLSQIDKKNKEVLFLRIDVTNVYCDIYETEVNLINASNFSFLVNSYDISTLFANKIIAFLERSFFKGKEQKFQSKGRDVYDLFWLLNLSENASFKIKPNKKRLEAVLNIKEDVIEKLIKERLIKVDKKFVYDDIKPLLESNDLLDSFIENYQDFINKKVDLVVG